MEGQVTIREITVLLLSGHTLSRYGLRAALESDPSMRVVAEADCPAAGFEAVANHSPDVAVLETVHPGRRACRITRALLEIRPTLAVLIVTNQICACTPAVLEAGACGVILKHVQPLELAAALRSAAAGYAVLPRPILPRLHVRQGRPKRSFDPAKLESLSTRELEVLRCLAVGNSNAQIAQHLHIGEGTVKSHIQHILTKLCVPDRVRAVIYAYEAGFVESACAVPQGGAAEEATHPATARSPVHVLKATRSG